MSSKLIEIFEDEQLITKIKKRLPYLFHLAELESSRAGKVGMEVGSLRERIIVALLIYRFGRVNVETEIPITESEIDVNLFGKPISIKTITSKRFGGVKLIWTVEPGTNPRDVEITKEALSRLVDDEMSKTVEIYWQKSRLRSIQEMDRLLEGIK